MESKPSKIRPLKWVVLITCFFMAGGCATIPLKSPDDFIARRGIQNVARSHFQICYNHGCSSKVDVQLTDVEWQAIRDIFSPSPENASAERVMLAKAVQTLEILTGEKTSINSDIGGSFPGVFKKDQMDCEDEAVNTNIFLILLQDDRLLNFHQLYGIARRGIFVTGWPHMAAAIIDTATKELFVIDSWFLDHGMPVHILPEKDWKDGWEPDYDKYKNTPTNLGQSSGGNSISLKQ